jgi:hypothetical protein
MTPIASGAWKADLRVETIEFLSKSFCETALGRQIVPDLLDGPFQLRGGSFQFASCGAVFREIGLEGFARLLEPFLFFLLQPQDLLLRLLK